MMQNLTECPICGSSEFDNEITLSDYFLTKETFNIVKCRECGFKFTNPRPPTDKIGSYYKSKEYISHSNATKGFVNSIYQMVRAFTLKKKFQLIRQLNTHKSLLDIGCATGEFLNFLKQSNWKVIGIEPDEDARNFSKNTYNLEVFAEDHLNVLKEKSFDVITMWHVLEHVPNLNERLQQIRMLLKDDGYAIFALPNCESFDAIYYGKYWAAYDVPRHLYHFTKNSFDKLISKHNFEVVEILPMKFDSYYVSMLSEKYVNGKPNLLKAIWIGFKSNAKAIKKMNYSSHIYLVRKNDAK